MKTRLVLEQRQSLGSLSSSTSNDLNHQLIPILDTCKSNKKYDNNLFKTDRNSNL